MVQARFLKFNSKATNKEFRNKFKYQINNLNHFKRSILHSNFKVNNAEEYSNVHQLIRKHTRKPIPNRKPPNIKKNQKKYTSRNGIAQHSLRKSKKKGYNKQMKSEKSSQKLLKIGIPKHHPIKPEEKMNTEINREILTKERASFNHQHPPLCLHKFIMYPNFNYLNTQADQYSNTFNALGPYNMWNEIIKYTAYKPLRDMNPYRKTTFIPMSCIRYGNDLQEKIRNKKVMINIFRPVEVPAV